MGAASEGERRLDAQPRLTMSTALTPDVGLQQPPAVASKDLFGAWWEIPHPGTLEKLKCATFNEAMDKWFEGFNIPVLVVDGVREDFSKACERVKRYYAAPKTKMCRRRKTYDYQITKRAECACWHWRPG